MSPRPGFVLDVDRSTPPTLFWHGERFSLERLPEGSRVIYVPEPIDPLPDPSSAIRSALTHPVGDRDPLPALLRPGMKLTIAFDDISLPLPPMERPDIRQMVIEQVLDMAAEAGVDDVALIVALALHRRMTEAELRHALGDRIYDAFAPNGLLTQHDAEDPDALVHLGLTDQGEDVEITRAAESDLLVYVNINLVAMDGGHKSVATGLASYKSLRHHHNPQTMQKSRSFMDQHRSELHSSNWRMGRLIADSGVTVFQIETTLNNDTFPTAFNFLREAGVGVGSQGPARRCSPSRRRWTGRHPGWPARSSTHAEDSYYNLLVQGFRDGQLNMKREAPPGLARLADPYDPAVNAAYIVEVGDMSYYKGKLYLYFGVTPAWRFSGRM